MRSHELRKRQHDHRQAATEIQSSVLAAFKRLGATGAELGFLQAHLGDLYLHGFSGGVECSLASEAEGRERRAAA